MAAENPALFGKWESYKCENMEAVLDKAGAPWLAKKMAGKTNPTMTIERLDDSRLRIGTKTMAATMEQELALGAVTRFKPPHGGQEQDCLAEWRQGKLLVLAAKPGAGDPRTAADRIVQTREILDNGELLLTIQCGDTVGKRWFKKA